jgi:hypothetical protein
MLERHNLELLRHETGLALSSKVSEILIPKAVVQAEYEKWVMAGGYEHDPLCFLRKTRPTPPSANQREHTSCQSKWCSQSCGHYQAPFRKRPLFGITSSFLCVL